MPGKCWQMNVYDLIPSNRVPQLKGLRWWWHIIICAAITLGIGGYEYVTSPLLLFPFAYVFPVAWVARYTNWRWGAAFSTAAVLWRIVTAWHGGFYYGATFHIVNVVGLTFCLTVVVGFLHELQKQYNTVEVLRGLLPICSHCKSIRDPEGHWHTLEDYMGKHAEAKFTHGICPHCMKRHFPEDAA